MVGTTTTYYGARFGPGGCANGRFKCFQFAKGFTIFAVFSFVWVLVKVLAYLARFGPQIGGVSQVGLLCFLFLFVFWKTSVVKAY